MDHAVFALMLAAALGSGLMAGLFFAFSISVMPALARQPAAQGMASMQAINVVIVNPLFLAVFLGTALASALVALESALRWEPGAGLALAGSLLYIGGGLLVTMFFNVPRNNALAAARPGEAGAALWARYLKEWTAWNHVRTLASLAASTLLTLALRLQP